MGRRGAAGVVVAVAVVGVAAFLAARGPLLDRPAPPADRAVRSAPGPESASRPTLAPGAARPGRSAAGRSAGAGSEGTTTSEREDGTTRSVRCRVVDEDGTPVPSLTWVVETSWKSEGRGSTDAEGRLAVAVRKDARVEVEAVAESDAGLRMYDSRELGAPDVFVRIEIGDEYVPVRIRTYEGLGFQGPDAGATAGKAAEDARDEPVLVRLRRGRLLSGTVLGPDEKPLGLVHLHVADVDLDPATDPWFVPSDAYFDHVQVKSRGDGSFRVRLPASAQQATIWVDTPHPRFGGDLYTGTYLRHVRPGSGDAVVRLGPALHLVGTVVDETGASVGEGSVEVEGTTSRLGLESVSGELVGRFDLGRLAPGGYIVRFVPKDDGHVASETVEVVLPGDPIRLVCPRARTLRGVVEGGAGMKASWVRMDRRWEEHSWFDGPDPVGREEKGAVVDASGRFEIAGVAPEGGALVVRLDGDERMGFVDHVVVGDEPVVVRLASGLAIEGRLEGDEPAGGQPRSIRASGPVIGIGIVRADGRYRVTGLPAGEYTLSLDPGGWNGYPERLDGRGSKATAGEAGVDLRRVPLFR